MRPELEYVKIVRHISNTGCIVVSCDYIKKLTYIINENIIKLIEKFSFYVKELQLEIFTIEKMTV